jgi:hypothetical protein
MAASSAIFTRQFFEPATLSNREALSRLIQYAWAEAEQEGARECAELLSAALIALERASLDTAGDDAAALPCRRLAT